MNNNRLDELVARYCTSEINKDELEEFRLLIASSDDEQLRESLNGVWESYNSAKELSAEKAEIILSKILQQRVVAPDHRVHFLRRGWFKYAAAVLLVGTVIAIMIINKQSKFPETDNSTVNKIAAIAPGTNKALLTLSDGQQVALDSAASETILDGSLKIKNADGSLTYENYATAVMNTMTTPNGGQYQLTLADGTKVWLNAASSITYPTAFVESNRRVKITGEVYFEVAKNKSKPFIIDIDGKGEVDVLGTSFNINAYPDEDAIKTTLVEGSVRVNGKLNLKPGQQAVITPSVNEIINANIDETLAWKNGLFNFNHADLKTIMRQLGRWYDLDIKFEGPIPVRTFRGKVTRDLNLSEALKLLEAVEIKFRLEGKTLIVMS